MRTECGGAEEDAHLEPKCLRGRVKERCTTRAETVVSRGEGGGDDAVKATEERREEGDVDTDANNDADGNGDGGGSDGDEDNEEGDRKGGGAQRPKVLTDRNGVQTESDRKRAKGSGVQRQGERRHT